MQTALRMKRLVKLETAYAIQKEPKILALTDSPLYPLMKNKKKLFHQTFQKSTRELLH